MNPRPITANSYYWSTLALFAAEFLVKRDSAHRAKAEVLEPLISVLRMHPNGHFRSLAKQKLNYFNLDFLDVREALTAIPPPKIGNCWNTCVVLSNVPAALEHDASFLQLAFQHRNK